MSTEQPEKDVTGPRRRRSPLAVVSVAAAVLLAGGGAAYWASTPQDRAAPASDGTAPPPLALGLPAEDPMAPAPGIAVGEPDPNDGRTVYRAAGELPKGPAEAAVHRATGAVTAEDVTRLASALGLPGTPRTEGAAWTVGVDGDGSGPFLRVTKQAPGAWTFARYGSGGPDACESASACAKPSSKAGSGSGSGAPVDDPVSEKAARTAAAPVLKAVGQDGAALDTRQLMGSVRVVNADPVVGGLPTYGWSTGIQVGPGGEIVGGSGHLKSLAKGDSYPLVGARAALDRLNAESRPGAKPGIGGCATSVPLEDDASSAAVDCASRSGSPRTATMTVEKAVLGLSARYADGEQLLVPSWLFSVRPDDGGAAYTAVRIAVDPAFLTEEGARPTDGTGSGTGDTTTGERRILSYGADGRTLDVTFWGGACSTYEVHATEDGSTVRVTVGESNPDPGKACVLIAEELTRTVTLDAPLGDRKVVDAGSGATVPRT
ncbi:hypothetical protein ACQSMD_13280 [Streptomyces flavovirens]|uniref:hypothetical protein n=1 Tax=Streptomyces TaxID=1883 RepID=UPI00081B173D|nr:hypothetical protein [Streptomyces sp. BpilaLS-43]SCD72796.1 hypothetical protein GA0115239_106712 [Streptomyces sp. BpilaLS-43]